MSEAQLFVICVISMKNLNYNDGPVSNIRSSWSTTTCVVADRISDIQFCNDFDSKESKAKPTRNQITNEPTGSGSQT